MINSMFSLDHRIAELRPSEREQRVAREARDAALSVGRTGKPAAGGRHAFTLDRYAGQASRLVAS
ncbi:MAG TPA: hypothetical protein VFI15_07335 [Candidatus Limnocylindrales bacterium]|nr:hypothetical protein [Candidatus Limnocylindrales bacterium]